MGNSKEFKLIEFIIDCMQRMKADEEGGVKVEILYCLGAIGGLVGSLTQSLHGGQLVSMRKSPSSNVPELSHHSILLRFLHSTSRQGNMMLYGGEAYRQDLVLEGPEIKSHLASSCVNFDRCLSCYEFHFLFCTERIKCEHYKCLVRIK